MTKARALVLAVALVLAAAAPPASATPGPPPSPAATARVVHAGWVRALRLMRAGWWCWRLAPGRLACTNADVDKYLNVVALDFGELLWLIRHRYECAGGPASWDCVSL